MLMFFLISILLLFLQWDCGVLAAHHRRYKSKEQRISELLHSIRKNIIQSEMERELKGKKTRYHKEEPHSVHQHSENYQYFIKNAWSKFTYILPVMVIGCNLNHERMGNRFGSFLTDIACAGMSGAHVIIIDTANRTKNPHYDVFFDSIPLVYVHPHPAANRDMAVKNYLKVCADGSFPWVSLLLLLLLLLIHTIY